jgi:integrase
LEAAQPNVREAVELFAAKHLAGKKSAAHMRYRLHRLVKEVGDRKLRDLTRKDIVAALERIAEGQVKGHTAKQLAGEVLIQSRRLWRFAVTHEWIEASCLEVLSRKDIDARPVRRNVALRPDELAILWRALGEPTCCKSDDITVAALRLLILTGQRECEVTDAEWSEFDLDAAIWRLPASAPSRVGRISFIWRRRRSRYFRACRRGRGRSATSLHRPCERASRYSGGASTMRWPACSSAAYSPT